VQTFTISPADFGLEDVAAMSFAKCSPSESAQLISDVLKNESNDEKARNIILINAAAAIYVAGKAPDLQTAFETSKESLTSGKASEKFRMLIEYTNQEIL
jgi:anthranilate phosphoribosyltransferase